MPRLIQKTGWRLVWNLHFDHEGNRQLQHHEMNAAAKLGEAMAASLPLAERSGF
jgi:hypothetical protein